MTNEFLKDHFVNKHSDQSKDQRIISREDGMFECKICNREMIRYGNAEKHMKLFHPPEEDDPLNFEESEVKEEVHMFSFTRN